jgi:hypothetical protein
MAAVSYGKVVNKATFDPPCEPYALTSTSNDKRSGKGKRDGERKGDRTGNIYFNACLANASLCTSPGAEPVVSLSYSQLSDGDIGP